MRNIFYTTLICLTALLLCGSCKQQQVYLFTSHREPALDGLHFLYSYDAYHWDSLPGVWLKPEVGNKTQRVNPMTGRVETPKYYPQSMMRDPSLCQGPDGTYHLAWTIAWSGEKGFGYASSKDLIHWSEQRIIPVMEDSTTGNVWAPEIFYDDERDQFQIAWSSSIPRERYTDADRLGTNGVHRQYYTTTKDFVHFEPTKPFYDPGFNSIDGYVLKRGDKDYVLVLKDNRKPGFSDLFCAFAEAPEGPYSQPTEKFAPTYSEGPCVVKVGEEYLIYFDVYRQGRYGAVSTRDFQTFTPIDDKISLPMGHKHGTIITIKESVLKKMLKYAAERDE